MAYSDTLSFWATATYNEISFVKWKQCNCKFLVAGRTNTLLHALLRGYFSYKSTRSDRGQESNGVIRGGEASNGHFPELDKEVE